MIKKILLSGIIFLIILFLQIIFSEKNFAKKDEEKITKTYNIGSCKTDIENEMKKIHSKSRKLYYKNMNNICKDGDENCLTLSKKGENISYNFRVLSCNFEAICGGLQSFMFYGEDGKKEWKNSDDEKIVFKGGFVTSSCPEIKYSRKIFQYCNTKNTKDFTDIVKFCEDEKDEILSLEYGWIEHNFKNDAKKDKVNFLAARIYNLNVKMRELVGNMTELKIKIVNIVNRLVCTTK